MLTNGYRFWGRPYRCPWLFGVVGQSVPPLPKWSTRALSVALLCPTTPQGERQEFANIQMDCQVPNSQYRKYTLAAPARKSQLFSTRKLCLAAPARRSQLVSTSAVNRKYTLAAPARKSQLFNKEIHFGSSARRSQLVSASVVKEVHFGSSASKVTTFQHMCSKGNALWQLRHKSRNFSVQV